MPTIEGDSPRVVDNSDISVRQELVPAPSDEVTRASRVSLPRGLSYVFLITSAVGIATFGLGFSLVRRKAPGYVLPPGEEPPVRVGARALFWGTVFSVAGTSSVALAMFKIAQLCGFEMVKCLQ